MKTFFLMIAFYGMGTFAYAQTTHVFETSAPKTAAARYMGLDMVELVGGTGESTDHGRLAMHWNLGSYRLFKKDFKLTLAGSYAFYGLAGENSSGSSELKDIGLTPTVLYNFKRGIFGLKPFIEGGIGFHYLTETDITLKDLSTHFQFGDHISIGVEFGKRLDYRVNYLFQHFSNGGIEAPNPGINFHMLSFGARLR